MINNRYKTVIVIPVRYASIRFPGKSLVEIDGKPMIYHVYNRSIKVKDVDEVIVATDDKKIKDAVESFNGKVVMTKQSHKSGADRIAEVAKTIVADIIVNVQGDEPLIEPKAIEEAIRPLKENENIKMSTLMTKITNEEEYYDPNVVKVVVDNQGFALYFSRSSIPFLKHGGITKVYKHIGLYAYRKNFLIELSEMEQTPLEKLESLEQLRALENCFKIRVVETSYNSISVDTPDDLIRIKQILNLK